VLISSVRPVYPEVARRTGSLGDVELELSIDATGRVTRAVAVLGPVVLRAAAVSAVLQWRYQPAAVNGTPVVSRRRVRVSFQ
jgi:protein TonB